MSLFGTSPDESGQLPSAKQQPNKSLFEDKTRSAPNASSSLFADDSGNDSPWSIPTPKKAGRSELIKNLVSPSNAPDSYVDAFDTMLESAESTNGRVSSDAVAKLLQSSGISSNDQSSLTSIIFSGGNASVGLERSTFHVLMALIGLAQEGDEATLDGVDERKNGNSARVYEDSIQLRHAQLFQNRLCPILLRSRQRKFHKVRRRRMVTPLKTVRSLLRPRSRVKSIETP